MIDISKLSEKIINANFFSKMGERDIHEEYVILVSSVQRVFVTPSNSDFNGLYSKTEWLPTSPTQDSPFYVKQKKTSELIELRKSVTKQIMDATKDMDKRNFLCPPHDFSLAARNAICFAFRELITENYYNLGDKWNKVTRIYFSGHWPVGYADDKFIVI